ncbi:unnamed protein product [Peniophora sp. CBMAI 1063]|nr:unnamed protein product [Peniophora sp. CBMAI 1063]
MSGKNRLLDENQARAVASVLTEEFQVIIRRDDPQFSGFPTVGPWVADRIDRILENALFRTADKDVTRRYRRAVDRKFRNYYHGLRLRESPFGAAVLKQLIPRTTAFRLFENAVKQELLETDDNGDEDYETRLNTRWSALTQDVRAKYEKEVEAVAKDVEHNRELLVNNLQVELDALCRKDTLGGMVAVTLLGYRDLNTNEMKISMCDGSTSDATLKFGNSDSEEKAALSALMETWREFSDRTIPCLPLRSEASSLSQGYPILRNSRNMPVFPDLDAMSISAITLEEILFRYYKAVWVFSRTGHSSCELPWDDLINNAVEYYDIDRYGFICFDKNELRKPGRLYSLVAELQKRCGIDSPEPFTFKPSPTTESGPFDRRLLSPFAPVGRSLDDGSDRRTDFSDHMPSYENPISDPSLSSQAVSVSFWGTQSNTAPMSMHSLLPEASKSTTPPTEGAARSVSQTHSQDEASQSNEPIIRRTKRRNTPGIGSSYQSKAPRASRSKKKDSVRAPTKIQKAQGPTPAQGQAGVFASQGYSFKLSKQLHRCYIPFDVYQDGGGCILDADEFDEKDSICVTVNIVYDKRGDEHAVLPVT